MITNEWIAIEREEWITDEWNAVEGGMDCRTNYRVKWITE